MIRRGGNCPNTIEVLQELVGVQYHASIDIRLLSVLPRRSAPAVHQIQQSLAPNAAVTDTCLYREDHDEPASSYIIRNLATNSRTIINYNALPEMTCTEFSQVAKSFGTETTWYHFEVSCI